MQDTPQNNKEEEKKKPNRRWRRALQLAIRRYKNKQPGDRFKCGSCGLRFVAPTAERCQCSVAKPGQRQQSPGISLTEPEPVTLKESTSAIIEAFNITAPIVGELEKAQ